MKTQLGVFKQGQELLPITRVQGITAVEPVGEWWLPGRPQVGSNPWSQGSVCMCGWATSWGMVGWQDVIQIMNWHLVSHTWNLYH